MIFRFPSRALEEIRSQKAFIARVHVLDQLGTFQSWLPLLGQYKYALNFACNGLAIIESIVMYGSLNYTNANNVLVSVVFSS